MRRVASCVAVGLTLGLAAPAGVSANWNEPVQQPVTSDAFWPGIVNVGGVPYVAWANGSPFRARVAQLVGGSWAAAGGDLNIDPTKNGSIPNVADVGGVPYVVWSEDAGTATHIYVKRFVGGTWEQVGAELDFPAHTGAYAPNIAGVGGTPYVVWRQIEAGVSKLYVKRFVANAWTMVGPGALNIGPKDAQYPKLADVAGVPTVAWLQTTGSGNVQVLRVKRFDGAAWVEPVTGAGGALNVDPTTDADNPSLAAIGGDPYVTWNERGTDGWKVHVKRLASGAWTLVGDPLNIGLDALEPSITDVNGTPFVVWRESTASPASEHVHVKQLIGQAWRTVGGVLNVDATKFGFSPTITSIGGVPYVAWKESTAATNYELRVKRLEPDIVSQSASPSPTTATLSAELDDFGVRLPVGFELGVTAVFGTQFSLQTTPGTGVSTLTQAVSGLTPATQYSYRAFGSDTFRQTALGGTQVFTTPVLPAPAVRPVLSNVGQSAKSWRRGNKLANVAARRRPRAPVGTVFSFRLNEDSAVKFAFARAAVGRKVSGRCVAPTNGNRRKPRCTRRLASGTLTVQGHVGANSLRFQGRLSRTKRLRPGRYTLTITATAQGLSSAPRSLRFTIVR